MRCFCRSRLMNPNATEAIHYKRSGPGILIVQVVFGFVNKNRSAAHEEPLAREGGSGRGRHVLFPHQHTATRSTISASVEPFEKIPREM